MEKQLPKCIESVLTQTYENYEIILINDGSTDQSGVICDNYACLDKRIRVFHQLNLGLIMARRNGIAKAIGDYYLFLDSDDYWDNDLLETVNDTIEKYDCDMVIYNYKKITPHNIISYEPIYANETVFDSNNKKQIFEVVLNSSQLNNLWTKAVKKDIVDRVDYSKYKKVKYAEDLLQSLPLLHNAKKIVYLDKPLYNYYINPTSITNNFNLHSMKDITIVREVVLDYIEQHGLNDKGRLRLFYQYYFNSVLTYLMELHNSKVPKVQRIEIMNQIRELHLYQNSLEYVEEFELSLYKKIQYHLFDNKYDKLFRLYAKTNHIVRYLRNLNWKGLQ